MEGKRLALINLNGEIYAVDDDCPHEGGPLSEGQIIGEEIECPWRTSHFNIKTGRVTMDPATKNVATYRMRLVGDAVEVGVPYPHLPSAYSQACRMRRFFVRHVIE